MIIFGLIGIILLFWFSLVGLWKLIPWLVLAVIITSTLGFIIDHFIFFIVVVIALIVMYAVGKKG
ncbi:hypothetical protein NE282_07695 [Leuconostoc mesenteroides]|uniref:hypothetical protein n=1 Tax=Leuconostoc mesenteroides TaxID=1245 RepID=UPI002072F1D0|nr:hypothetical protein [Leuconostoc mesenteroides]MCM6833766.1 hypothetical protein [Leuconostoc mesenteroides]